MATHIGNTVAIADIPATKASPAGRTLRGLMAGALLVLGTLSWAAARSPGLPPPASSPDYQKLGPGWLPDRR